MNPAPPVTSTRSIHPRLPLRALVSASRQGRWPPETDSRQQADRSHCCRRVKIRSVNSWRANTHVGKLGEASRELTDYLGGAQVAVMRAMRAMRG